MAKVKIQKRTGKDLIQYLKRSNIDQKMADIWAMENFVTVDNNNLSTEQISNLSDKSYLQISSKLFPLKGIVVDTEGDDLITDAGVVIRAKEIHRDLITKIQIETKNSNGNYINLMLSMVKHFYEIDIKEIEELDYRYLAYMMEKMNFFLSELTTPIDEFDIDDIFYPDTGTSTPASLDRMVSECVQILEKA